MDALELLRNDHDIVRGLFKDFESAKESDDMDRMRELQAEIFTELEVHTSIEEEVFYPEAVQVGGEAEELVNEGVQEHHVVKVLMREINNLSASSEDEWKAKMTVLIENVEHHADEEEEELFPQLRDAFGDERLAKVGEKLEQAKQRHQS